MAKAKTVAKRKSSQAQKRVPRGDREPITAADIENFVNALPKYAKPFAVWQPNPLVTQDMIDDLNAASGAFQHYLAEYIPEDIDG